MDPPIGFNRHDAAALPIDASTAMGLDRDQPALGGRRDERAARNNHCREEQSNHVCHRPG
jgi:hypothetical protein